MRQSVVSETENYLLSRIDRQKFRSPSPQTSRPVRPPLAITQRNGDIIPATSRQPVNVSPPWPSIPAYIDLDVVKDGSLILQVGKLLSEAGVTLQHFENHEMLLELLADQSLKPKIKIRSLYIVHDGKTYKGSFETFQAALLRFTW